MFHRRISLRLLLLLLLRNFLRKFRLELMYISLMENISSSLTHLHGFQLLMMLLFEKLVNNRNVDHLEKCGLFSDFQYGFTSSQSTADLLTVVSDRIARAFNRSGATRAVALDISKTFGMLVYFTNSRVMESQVRYLAVFLLFLVIDAFEQFWMESLRKSIQLMMVFLWSYTFPAVY